MTCLSSRTSKRTMAKVHALMFEFDVKSTVPYRFESHRLCSLLGPELFSSCVKYEQKTAAKPAPVPQLSPAPSASSSSSSSPPSPSIALFFICRFTDE